MKKFKLIFASIFIVILLAAISVFLILKLYNINFQQTEQVFNFGWNFDFIQMDEIDKYYTNNIGKIDVLQYNLDINIELNKELIHATAKIKFIPIFHVDNFISLDFSSDFKIISVTGEGKELQFKKLKDQINIELPLIKKDTLEIEIKYSGNPENKGMGSFLFTEVEAKNEKRILTLNEPIFASTWFPCNDYPDDKAQLKISITNDSAYTSVSNGKLVATKINDDKKTFTWETVYPVSTYLIGFYSAIYKTVEDSIKFGDDKILPINYYIINEEIEKSIYDLEVSKEAIIYFSEVFGEYPFLNEKYGIAEFDWQLGAIENQTIVGIGSNLIGGNRFFSDVIIHEAAHHWWGNAVGLKSWEDIWLNEGFASYSEALFWENKSGREALISTLFSKRYDFNDTKLFDPDGFLFSPTIYNKGAWVLHMLRFELGENNFKRLLKEFFQKYKYSNASSDDFKILAEKISGKNLNKFFDQWIYEGIGFIYADYSFTNNGKKTSLKISQIQDGYEKYDFPLEVEVIGDSENYLHKFFIHSKDTTLNFISPFNVNEVKIDPNNWMLANFIQEDSK